MRILIVDDEEKLVSSLKKGLEGAGYAVDYVLDGEAGERRIELYHNDYDLILLDLMLPKKNGFEVCRDIRNHDIAIPILILTARDTIEDKVLALDSGGDDYLAKPFSLDELLARIRALLRRPSGSLGTELRVGDLVLRPATHEVYRGDERIILTLKEFAILQYLMRHPNQVIEREDLYAHLWDFADNALSNTIDVHVKNLRRKLGNNDHGKLLETIRGVGYRFKA